MIEFIKICDSIDFVCQAKGQTIRIHLNTNRKAFHDIALAIQSAKLKSASQRKKELNKAFRNENM